MLHRPVRTEDLEKICEFPQDAQELYFMFPKANYPLTRDQLSEAIANRSDSTVVEIEGEVVAFANFYHVEESELCCVGNVVVSRKSRGRGVASFLMHAMSTIALKKYKVTDIRVSCFSENTAGLLLYSKLDFLPFRIEERVDKFGHRQALIHFCRSSVSNR